MKNLLPIAVAENLSPYFQAAREKFGELNPEQPLQTWLDKVAVVPPGQPVLPPKIDAAIQRTVYEAVLKNRQLEMRCQPVTALRPRRYVPVNPPRAGAARSRGLPGSHGLRLSGPIDSSLASDTVGETTGNAKQSFGGV
ncbi:hypothetical protein sS8_3440 [Methylocaldum marinum]|uniref:Uncharacterized protein n=1 Tax=Methylocaldum marinum TaxID=1432792 RepID=A0A250KUN5_9GAMM|nr:hypothetical protein [Methylocaldum marinum]BBA35378.1 hypothetical protein sS8_3440 [Methylocaldum marinum]